MTVDIFNAAFTPVMSSVTDATGRYSTTGLVSGTTTCGRATRAGYQDEIYAESPCPASQCAITTGTPVAVVQGAPATVVDMSLAKGAQLLGLVLNDFGVGISGMTVTVFNTLGVPLTTSLTDAAGRFATTGLPAGTYYARTQSEHGYEGQLYSGLPCPSAGCLVTSGTPITVGEPEERAGVNFRVFVAASISGIVTVGGLPAGGVTVSAYTPAGVLVASATTSLAGSYTIQNLDGGSYRVRTFNTLGVPDLLYNGIVCGVGCFVGAGTPVGVAPNAMTGGINFTLGATAATGTITGSVTDQVTGAPLAGVIVQIVRLVPPPIPGPPLLEVVQNALTNALGVYSAQNLPVGSYIAFTANFLGYMNEAYDNIPCTLCSFVAATATPDRRHCRRYGLQHQLHAHPGGPVGVNHRAGDTRVERIGDRRGFRPGVFGVWHTCGRCDHRARRHLHGRKPFRGAVLRSVHSGRRAPSISSITASRASSGVQSSRVRRFRCSPAPPWPASTSRSPTRPRFAGRVTSATTGAGIPGVLVAVFNNTGGFVTNAFTDGSGNYSTPTLAVGTYYAKVTGGQGFLDQLYSGVPCALGCTTTDGTPIVVQNGQTTPGINFSLAASARITGNVRSTSGTPIGFAPVAVFYDDGTLHSRVFTDGSGNYAAQTNLVTGAYFVKTAQFYGFIDEVFDDKTCFGCDPTTGTPVLVAEGTTTPAINFVLSVGGSIGGRQTASATGAGIFGSFAEVFDSAGTLVSTAFTDASGNYFTFGLPSGTYYVRTRNNSGYRDELYNDVPCTFGGCSPLGGAPVTVTAALPTTGINFSLDQLGRISGTVKNALGQPINFTTVRAYTLNGMPVNSSFATFPNGQFTVVGLPAGSYYLVASATGFKQQAYDQVAFTCIDNCSFTGTPIAVGEGQSVTDINFVLASGGRIAGHMSDAATEAFLAGIAAEIYDASNTLVARASSDASGNYTSDAGLPSGNYFLRTRNNRGYQDQLHAGLPCHNCVPSSGTPIVVVDGVTTPNVDLQLVQGSRISGSIRANDRALPNNTGFLFNVIDGPGLFVSTAPSDGSGNYLATRNTTLVNVFDSTGAFVTSTTTDASGNYTTKAGLADGTYYAVTATSAGYINELYGGQSCLPGCNPLDGTPIQVAGQHVNGVNFDLTKAGRIAGTIRDAVSGLPLRNLWVDVYDGSNTWVSTAYSDSTGAYITNQGLPTGTYFARTRDTARLP